MRPTFFGTIAGSSSLPFDNISMDHVGIWDLIKRRTAYEGYAVRAGLAADSGATTLDIGFNADGSFDMDAYEAFGTGSERIITWYDQSGNGFDLTRAWSAVTCPIIRTSTYNSKPCVYLAGGNALINAGFTDWNGLADVNFFMARRLFGPGNGASFGGVPSDGYPSGGDPNRITYWQIAGGVYKTYNYNARTAGSLDRYRFAGGGATKIRFYENTAELTAASSSGSPSATFPNQTGLGLNALADGSQGNNLECFAFYYVGQDLSADSVTIINEALNISYFTFTDSQIFCCGDSLTLNSANGGPSDPDAYPNLLDASLSSLTGTTWNLFPISTSAEPGASTTRVLQLMEGADSVLDQIDTHYPDHIVVAWAGTNNLGAGGLAADALTGSLNITTAAQVRGATVYYLNMLPRQDLGAGNAAFEAARTTYNAGLVAALGSTATVVDVAGIPELADPNDTDYYLSDKVHLNDAGNALVANVVAAAIEADL